MFRAEPACKVLLWRCVACVISNSSHADGLGNAAALGVVCEVVDHELFAIRAEFDGAPVERIDMWQPAWEVLTGFMRILTLDFKAR